jgi:L-seryl-tRNA(Ser) seleniumtransferase
MATYDDLGVASFINASGTITTLGGSLMDKEVLAAMGKASSSYIDLNDLLEKAGSYLARRIGVEAAFISAGAASGMQLAAAACLTGTDEKRVKQLPHTDGWKNEFVISRVDPHIYIHQGIELCGGRLARVGSETDVTAESMVAAVGPETAAVVFFLGRQSKEQLAEVIAGVAGRVPVVVDAAAQLPPRSNLTEIVAMGASLVVFSGGKGIRGPQCTGLVLGERMLVEAARMNASPWSAAGRGMKVGKEEILGLVTAVELFLKGDDEEDRMRWKKQATRIVAELAGIRDVRAYIGDAGQPAAPDFTPRAYLDLERARAERIIDALRAGRPSIVVRRAPDGIVVDPMTMEPGEEEVVARRLAEELARP